MTLNKATRLYIIATVIFAAAMATLIYWWYAPTLFAIVFFAAAVLIWFLRRDPHDGMLYILIILIGPLINIFTADTHAFAVPLWVPLLIGLIALYLRSFLIMAL